MPFSRPATLPRWADVSGAIVVPTSGKLDVGFVAGERPPAQYLNWDLNLIYQWIAYLSNQNGGQKSVPITGGEYTNLTVQTIKLTATGGWAFTSILIDLPVGARITFYRVVFNKADTTTTVNKLVYLPDLSTSFAVVDSHNETTAGSNDVTYAVGSPVAIAAGQRWHLAINGAVAVDEVRQLEVFWDRPSA